MFTSTIYKDGNDLNMPPLGRYSEKDEELVEYFCSAVLLTQETVSVIQPISQGYLPSNWMDLV